MRRNRESMVSGETGKGKPSLSGTSMLCVSKLGPSYCLSNLYLPYLIALTWSSTRFALIMEKDPYQLLQDSRVEHFRQYFDYRLGSGRFHKQSSIWTEWKNLLSLYKDDKAQEVYLQIELEMHGVY